jgi:YVTN family beta-propeller protein
MRVRVLPFTLLLAFAGCGQAPRAPADRLYVTNEMSGDLTVVDLDSRRVIGRIALGKRPRGIVASPDGRLLYIALSGSPAAGPGVDESTLPPPDRAADGIAVFDVASGRVERVLRGVPDPETIAVSPDGRSLYVASEDSGRLFEFDARSGAVRGSLAVGGEPEGTAASPDGRLVYATSEEDGVVAVVETATRRLRARIPVGARPRSAVFSADGRRAFVPGEGDATVTAIDVAADRAAGVTRLGGPGIRPMGVALGRDGRALFLTTGRGRQLVRLDPASLRITGRVEVGARPWGLALSGDGRFVFTANGPSNDVAMVDAASLRVVARFRAGQRPWGVAVVGVR